LRLQQSSPIEDVDDESKADLMGLLQAAGNTLTAKIAASLLTQGRQIMPAVQSIRSQMSGILNRMGANKTEIRKKSETIVSWCGEGTRSLARAEKLCDNDELRKELKPIYESIASMRNAVVSYT
jgi:hypothetical protein